MSQQQQMNMAAMGGPVGGGGMGGPQMNAGTPGNSGSYMPQESTIKRLNTAIYDYLLRNELYDIAKAFHAKVPIETKTDTKQSPNQRGSQQANGVDDSMDIDSKDQAIMNRPEGLPLPGNIEGPFLQDWWCQFWEMWRGHRKLNVAPNTQNYITAQRAAQQRMGMMNPNGMQNLRGYNGMMPGMNNGMAMQNDLKRAAMQNQQRNMTPQQQQQMMQKMQAQQNGQVMQGNQQMERQGSQMDNMSGPRSGSPGSGDAPSPKRQRIEGNMQTMNQGRPGQPGQMQGNQVGLLSDIPDPALLEQTRELLRKKNIDPDSVSPQVLRNLTMQPTNIQAQSVEVYSSSMQHNMQQQMQAAMNNSLNKSNVNKGIPPNMAPGGAQGSPMSQAGMDGATGEFYAAANGGGRMPMQANAAAAAAGAAGQAGNNNGNHALQDYQMQLMLLEQQNKKRLLMARQEQDNMTHPAGVGPNGAFAPQGMSPQGSQRGGDPSPNPNDMQRGMIDPSQMPPQMRAQMMAQAQNGQMVGRPPSSNPMANMTPQQMELLRQQQGAQMANGQFHPGGPQQGQMMQGGQPGPGGQPMGTPRQASNMPPPPAPQANAGGTGPSSPAQQPPPPTPTQQNKAKPGAKKETAKKGAAAKKNAPNATPASEAEQPPTPTPATPITPMNAASFNKNQQLPNGQPAPTNAQANASQANSQQQSQQASQNATANATQQPAPPSAIDSMGGPFGNLDADGFAGMPLDFSIGDNGDVLDNFDFDSFLNQDNEMGLPWDPSVFGDAIDTGGLEGN